MISVYIPQAKAPQKLPLIQTARQFQLVLMLCACLGAGVGGATAIALDLAPVLGVCQLIRGGKY